MKIYVINDPDDTSAFRDVLKATDFPHTNTVKLDAVYYYLDNSTRELCQLNPTDKETLNAISNKWFLNPSKDGKKIIKMYKNEILCRFNSGKPQWSLMDHEAMLPMIDVLEFGAKKYSPDNWRKPIDNPMEIYESAQRHMFAIKDGMKGYDSPYDVDSALNHIGHAMCNLMFLSHHLIKNGDQERKNPEIHD